MKIKFKKYDFGNLVIGIPSEIGPRIIYFSLKEKDNNLFGIVPDFVIKTEEGPWHIYGGHRLWLSPEDKPRSYSLDNKPVKIEEKKNSVIIYGNPEIKNSVQKIIEVRKKGKNKIEVIHKIKNIGRWPITLSAWALSVMKKGGYAILPVKSRKIDKNGLLPDRHITFWPYTDISDKRLIFKKNFILLKQDEKIEKPVKVGTFLNPLWTGYFVDNLLFLKEIENIKGQYPDYGCNVETFTNNEFLELETLSPLKEVKPGEILAHKEIWSVRKDFKSLL